MADYESLDPFKIIEELPSIHEPVQRLKLVRKRDFIWVFFFVWGIFLLLGLRIENTEDPALLRTERLWYGAGLDTVRMNYLENDRLLAEQLGITVEEVLTGQRVLQGYFDYVEDNRRIVFHVAFAIPIGNWRLLFPWRVFLDAFPAFAIAALFYYTKRNQASEYLIEAQNTKYQQLNRALEAKVIEGLKIIHELNRTRDKLVAAEKLASIGRLSATLAHEIRNPLSIMRSALGIVEMDLKESGSDADQTFDLIKGEISRLDDLISELLNFAKPRPPNLSRHDIQSLVRHWLPPIVEELEKSGIQVVPQLENEPGDVFVDADQLYQVFLNLVWNARDAMAGQENAHLFVRTEDGGPHFLKLVIQDTGPGMLPDVVEQIKEPFFTTKTQGSGLGIPLSIQLIEGMYGDFHVKSVPEWGTEVTLSLARGHYGEQLENERLRSENASRDSATGKINLSSFSTGNTGKNEKSRQNMKKGSKV